MDKAPTIPRDRMMLLVIARMIDEVIMDIATSVTLNVFEYITPL
jgi:hypothetical protein